MLGLRRGRQGLPMWNFEVPFRLKLQGQGYTAPFFSQSLLSTHSPSFSSIAFGCLGAEGKRYLPLVLRNSL